MRKLILLVFLLLPLQGFGDFFTGKELLDACEAYLSGKLSIEIVREHNDPDYFAKGKTCSGYVTGIADVHETFVNQGNMKSNWCMPKGTATKQLVQVVVIYLEKKPEELHKDAGGLVRTAFIAAFPCQ